MVSGRRLLLRSLLLLAVVLLSACNDTPGTSGGRTPLAGATSTIEASLPPGPTASQAATSTPTAISVGSPEPTDTAAACTFPATGTTEAWLCDGQVLASIGGNPATALSDFTYPPAARMRCSGRQMAAIWRCRLRPRSRAAASTAIRSCWMCRRRRSRAWRCPAIPRRPRRPPRCIWPGRMHRRC